MLQRCSIEAVKKAISHGQDEAEAFAQKKRGFIAEFSEGRITRVIERESQGIGIRVIHQKAIGFAYSTDLSTIMVPVKKAMDNAQIVSPDPFFRSLPHPQAIPHIPSLSDPRLQQAHTTELIDMVSELLSSIEQGTGTIQITVRECAISNSHEVSVAYKKSDCSVKFAAAPHTAASYCNFSQWDTQALTQFMENEILQTPVPEKRMKWDNKGDIILEPNAVPNFIRPFIMALNGKNVVNESSFLRQLKDNEILSHDVSLYDDGCYPNGLFTQPVDAEGVPSQTTVLLEEGVLKNFIYDSYHAFRDGTQSTGNALRQGFKDLPGCMFTNVILDAGESPFTELVEDTHHGIIINSLGANVVDPRSPHITLSVSRGGLIEKGEIVGSLYPTVLMGNVLTMMQHPLLSRERKQIFRFIVPWIQMPSSH
ncbi:MAG: TldD/PmbA family protein [Theionarchaea archaeon]|nr:TldD/PmbA family protein [Theionarchaea archaeon]